MSERKTPPPTPPIKRDTKRRQKDKLKDITPPTPTPMDHFCIALFFITLQHTIGNGSKFQNGDIKLESRSNDRSSAKHKIQQ